MILATPVANYTSSVILPQKPWLIDYQIRNYVPIFLLSIGFYLVLLTYIYFGLGEIKQKSETKKASWTSSYLRPVDAHYLAPKNSTNNAFEKDLNIDDNNNKGDLKESKIRFSLSDLSTNAKPTIGEMFRNLFKLENAVAMIKSVIKKREENSHLLLWLTMIIYLMLVIFSGGMYFIMLPFVRTVYGWNASDLMASTFSKNS